MKLLSKAVLAFSLSAASLFAGDAAQGKMKYMTCMACHGLNGEGNVAMKAPKISGQEDWYVKAQLNKFKNDIRGAHPKDVEGMQMAPMAKMLASDTDVENVVAYIKTLKEKAPAETVKGDAALGKSMYATCMACHGVKAEGNAAMKAPKLTGQNDWYLVSQLKKFKSGVRGAHSKDVEGQMMAPMAKILADDAAINNVVAYINSLSK